jgi:hypothetical protein
MSRHVLVNYPPPTEIMLGEERNSNEGSPTMTSNRIRSFALAAVAAIVFATTLSFKTPEANAVVYCAAGVYRAGCVARPVVGPTVRGVARRTARRTTRRVVRRY